MQETLTHDIASGLREEAGETGVAVEVTVTHLCEAIRGVERATETTTRSVVGEFSESAVQQFDRAIDSYTRQ
jgi:GTP cyclohydrolase I